MTHSSPNIYSEMVLSSGNEAAAEAAVRAGCRFYAGYPITPQNELTAYMSRRLPEVDGTFIQAESELAAINMVFGASTTGTRAMTSSSSPGISLKQEGISYMAGCELPGVIINMMRGGPGLGNITPAQSDYFQAVKGGGHGDYKVIVLAPSTCQELITLTGLAFELADKYRNPTLILGDAIIAQTMEPVTFPLEKSEEEIKSLSAGKDWTLGGAKGRPQRIIRSLFLKEGALEAHNRDLQRKFTQMQWEVQCEEQETRDARLILVAFGSVARISRSVVSVARKKGYKVGLIRPVTLWPFPDKIIAGRAKDKVHFLVVEMNAGQMVEDVRLSAGGKSPVSFYGRMGGGIPTEEEIFSEVQKLYNAK